MPGLFKLMHTFYFPDLLFLAFWGGGNFFLFSSQGIPCYFKSFPLLSQGVWGFDWEENPCFFGGSLGLFNIFLQQKTKKTRVWGGQTKHFQPNMLGNSLTPPPNLRPIGHLFLEGKEDDQQLSLEGKENDPKRTRVLAGS